MREPSGQSLGMLLGWCAVATGIFYLGLGFANLFGGQKHEMVDGLLMGGLALAAGCVILDRRRRMARSNEGEPGRTEPDRGGS